MGIYTKYVDYCVGNLHVFGKITSPNLGKIVLVIYMLVLIKTQD